MGDAAFSALLPDSIALHAPTPQRVPTRYGQDENSRGRWENDETCVCDQRRLNEPKSPWGESYRGSGPPQSGHLGLWGKAERPATRLYGATVVPAGRANAD